MNTKSILLAYASRFGSTQEVAETIATTLREAHLEVDIQPIQEVKSLDRYAAIVLPRLVLSLTGIPLAVGTT